MATPAELLNEKDRSSDVEEKKYAAVAWTALGFALLQSVCTVLIGLGGARILIGLLSLATALPLIHGIDWVHRDWLRIPMMAFAVGGAVVNLIVVWQVRRLRSRPSARWRLDVASLPRKVRQEWWQVGLSVVTLVLVVVEEVVHRGHVHRW